MRMILIAGAALLLAGCAITPEKMAKRSDLDVCRYTLSSAFGVMAKEEAKHRSLDCTPIYPVIAAQDAAAAAGAMMMLNAAQQMTQRQPIYTQPPQQVFCSSQAFGSRVDTTCH